MTYFYCLFCMRTEITQLDFAINFTFTTNRFCTSNKSSCGLTVLLHFLRMVFFRVYCHKTRLSLCDTLVHEYIEIS